MTYLAKAYSADYYEREKSKSSINSIRTDLYQINADAFTDINSVYEGSLFGFQRIQHSFRPRVGWVYRPMTSAPNLSILR